MSKVLSQKERQQKKSTPSRWKNKLFDCFKDDYTLCLIGFFCMNTSLPQMYERIIIRGYCFFITIVLWVSFFLIFTPVSTIESYENLYNNTTNLNSAPVINIVTGAVSFIIFFTLIVKMLTSIRTRIRVRDNIEGSECDDCCTSLFCSFCTHIQHMKHDGITSNNYNLISPTTV